MKSIACLALFGLLAASASAAPDLLGSVLNTVQRPFASAQSAAQSQSHSLGGNIGFGPLNLGAGINTASSKSQASSSSYNHGYEQVPNYRPEYNPIYSESQAAASAQSNAHSIGGEVGLGPFKLGSINFGSEAHSSASAASNKFERIPSYRPGYSPEYAPEYAPGYAPEYAGQAAAQAYAESKGEFRRHY